MLRPFIVSFVIMAALTTYTLIVTRSRSVRRLGCHGLHSRSPSPARCCTAVSLRDAAPCGGGPHHRADGQPGLPHRTVESRRGLQVAAPLLRSMTRRSGTPLLRSLRRRRRPLERQRRRCGRAVENAVIRRTAEALRRQCREADLLCRWGGDEFVVLGAGACRTWTMSPGVSPVRSYALGVQPVSGRRPSMSASPRHPERALRRLITWADRASVCEARDPEAVTGSGAPRKRRTPCRLRPQTPSPALTGGTGNFIAFTAYRGRGTPWRPPAAALAGR